MKTLLMTLLAASAATTFALADEQRPTTGTRKQAEDAGERPFLPDTSTQKGGARMDATKSTRKQGLNAGTPFLAPSSKTMRDENKAEDRNLEDTLQTRPDGAADAPSR